jgi:glyoxylate reductase
MLRRARSPGQGSTCSSEGGERGDPAPAERPVVLLPHMGSATIEGRTEMGEKVIINIKTFADGHRPPDRVIPAIL